MSDLDRRLRDALGDAATRIAPDGTRPPELDRAAARRPPRWTYVALAAAAAMVLMVAVPYGIRQLPKLAKEQQPATVTAAPADPPALGKPRQLPTPPNVLPVPAIATLAATSDLRSTSAGNPPLRPTTAAPDRSSFYTAWTDAGPTCTGHVGRLAYDSVGRASAQKEIAAAEVDNREYTGLAVSPDGTKLAMSYHDLRPGRICVSSEPTRRGIVVLDLTTGEQRGWTSPDQEEVEDVTMNPLAWSLDSRYLVFSADLDDDYSLVHDVFGGVGHVAPKAYRVLDPTVATGDLDTRSRPLPYDKSDEARGIALLTATTWYPPALTGYASQGGARVLALANDGVDVMLLDVRLGSGSVTVLDPRYRSRPDRTSW